VLSANDPCDGSASPLPASAAWQSSDTFAPCQAASADSHDHAGALRSIFTCSTRAVVQLPATSQTLTAFVLASASSVPAGTSVDRASIACDGSARPEPPSDTVHDRVTLPGCHPAGAGSHCTAGGVAVDSSDSRGSSP
jgi:hypothetical protein